MIKVTANVLRQQITNREGIINNISYKANFNIDIFFLILVRRLHREIKEVLDDYSQSHDMKCKLLTGRRVTLVEELSEYCTILKFQY